MPAPLRCPTCSAPLDVPPEHATVVRCTYCGASVLLAERGGRVHAAAQQSRHTDAIAAVLRDLRAGNVIRAIRTYREHFGVGLAEAKYAVERLAAGQHGGAVPPAPSAGPASPSHARSPAAPPPSSARRMIAAALLVALVGAGVVAVRAGGDEPADPAAPGSLPTPRAAPASPLKEEAPPAFAEPVMRFGSEGTGAGRFQDARSVAVDGAGRIYVAEYSGGRVQAFDSAGTFLTQWMADPRSPVLDLEVDRGGTAYVVQSGRVRRYEGATGRALDVLPLPRGASVNDLAVALDGTLWAVSDRNRVMHLDADGRVLKTIDAREAIDEQASPDRVAVAGTGDLYLTDTWTGVIYHLGRDGRFRNRFGGRGDGPGTMSAPQDIVVDGRGRVYASDMMGGVHVFDADGRFVAEFATAGIFGIAFNDRDELFASHRNDAEIVKYRLAR
ncbi:MAG TPA: hypothetical protein VHG93_21650 [Longimicrobium sp.]|nr:hypothetical protein [Longimicrobium sp.]